ncbi:MAG: HAD family phosphatase [Anaerolineae bacterium]|nr:HAD family phosphatase [Anaerolineae bacterium]MBL8107523.1 HAD family phosphatase [Anaerolineales bacterium]MCC7190407.1 HAD family phosphatase [Anaerolineales bacterium]HQU35076.1 HAD family phosphatase [Anaerolineales bacterium]
MTLPLVITTLFLDIGGVLLTNGWDRKARVRAAEKFGLDYDETDERHHLTFDTYEEGKLSLDEYLNRVVFYEKRPFSREEFKSFMYAQSQPFPEMIELMKSLKRQYHLRIAVVSNEGRELTTYRVRQFQLNTFIDFFVSSCFVHYRKPDADIYRMALDIAQASPEQVIYVDDRPLFVEVAQGLGIRGVIHKEYKTTQKAMEGFGLSLTR